MPQRDGPQQHDLAAILQRLQALETRVTTLETENAALRQTTTKQDAIIRKYQAMLFGKKSEKGAPDAAVSPAADATAPDAPASAEASQPPGARGQRRGAPGHGRRLYDELPPRTVLHTLPEAACRCATCGAAYTPAGTEDATTIDWEVTIRRVIHQRQQYQRTCACPTPVMRTAPPPPKLIPKGLLEVSAIANLVVNKFLHGQPINRQLHELALRCGVRFAPGTFRERFGPDVLRNTDGEALLELMHGRSTKDNLMYWLEFKDDDEFPAIFGSIAGGSALKFGIFQRKETGAWVTGYAATLLICDGGQGGRYCVGCRWHDDLRHRDTCSSTLCVFVHSILRMATKISLRDIVLILLIAEWFSYRAMAFSNACVWKPCSTPLSNSL